MATIVYYKDSLLHDVREPKFKDILYKVTP